MLTAVGTDIHRVGLTLYQAFTFKNPHKIDMSRLYDGTEIIGTEEAIKAEMKDVWERMKGQEGTEMRARMRGIKQRCKDSWSAGEARRAMVGMAQYFFRDA
jgi:hypothetical protein